MQPHKETYSPDTSACATTRKELKTRTTSPAINLDKNKNDSNEITWYYTAAAKIFFHYFSIFIIALATWGSLWCALGDDWGWNGSWFPLIAVPAVAWALGELFHGLTTLPALLACLLTGILARQFNFLNIRQFIEIDAFLRKIYPLIILGKASLGWDVHYMKRNFRKVAALGVLPWTADALTMMLCTHLILGFPLIWGFLFGTGYASVSTPVVLPTIAKISNGANTNRQWLKLIGSSSGLDTGLSVGMYGVTWTYIFIAGTALYKYVKVFTTFFIAVAVGITWGSLAGLVPHSLDFFITEIRVLFIMTGAIFGSFFFSIIGWGGLITIAVLSCNSTAVTFWVRDGWVMNDNPAATAYRVLWAIAEPFVFTYSGTFLVINSDAWKAMLYGLAIMPICISMRLAVAALVCKWCWNMNLKETIFVCCVWLTKSIVEVVIVPISVGSVLMSGQDKDQMRYVDDMLSIIILVVFVTTPIGFLTTKHLGPRLLQKPVTNSDNESGEQERKPSRSQMDVARL